MSARGKARKRALDMLFECDARGLPLDATLADRTRDSVPNPYTVTLVEGVAAQQGRVDEVISTYAHGWDLDRMPAVDRAVLRIGVYELLWADDVPAPVAVSEAVRLATELSTDESPAFVNGVLSTVALHRDELTQNGGGSASGSGPVPDSDGGSAGL